MWDIEGFEINLVNWNRKKKKLKSTSTRLEFLNKFFFSPIKIFLYDDESLKLQHLPDSLQGSDRRQLDKRLQEKKIQF